jgi:hypothetical protein
VELWTLMASYAAEKMTRAPGWNATYRAADAEVVAAIEAADRPPWVAFGV